MSSQPVAPRSSWSLLYAAVCPTAAAAQVSHVGSPVLPALPRLVDSVASTCPTKWPASSWTPTGQPLAGAVVSALGSASVYAVSDRDGRFVLRNLQPGPYVVRAHLQGYAPARGRVVQVSSAPRGSLSITLQKRVASPTIRRRCWPPASARRPAPGAGRRGAGQARSRRGGVAPAPFRRSVLKEATSAWTRIAGAEAAGNDPRRSGLGHGRRRRAWRPSCLPDLALNGQFNLLTSTSFDRPQDLFSPTARMPRGVAFLSLVAPGDGGEWRMRGHHHTGRPVVVDRVRRRSCARRDAAHAYEAGVSYAMQRYFGRQRRSAGGAARRQPQRRHAVRPRQLDGVAARSSWATARRYADYDYLDDERLFSPQRRHRRAADARPIRPSACASTSAGPRPRRARWSSCRRRPASGCRRSARSRRSGTGGSSPQRVDHVEAGIEQEFGDRDRLGPRLPAGRPPIRWSACSARATGRLEHRALLRRFGGRFRCPRMGRRGGVRGSARIRGRPWTISRPRGVAARLAPVLRCPCRCRMRLPARRPRSEPVGLGRERRRAHRNPAARRLPAEHGAAALMADESTGRRRPFRSAGQPGAAVPGVHQREVGSAGGRAQHVLRRLGSDVALRRDSRRPPADAGSGRCDGQVLATGRWRPSATEAGRAFRASPFFALGDASILLNA